MNTTSKNIKKLGGIGMAGTGIWAVMLLLCALAVLIPKSGWGLDPLQEHIAFVTSLPQGTAFDNDGSSYAWLPTLGAVNTATGTTSAAETAAIQTASTSGNFVEQKGPYLIYKQSSASEAAVASGPSSGTGVQTYPVVLNTQTHSIGILTGRLFLKLKDLQNADAIAKDYGLALSFVNIPMSTAFYEIPSGETVNLLALRTRLQSDDRILTVTLDMMDRISRPR